MIRYLVLNSFFLSLSILHYGQRYSSTTVSIKGEDFYINGKPTYKGRIWNNIKIEGLLLNSRMVQGIFDDLNPATRALFIYPDTKKWDPERNTDEFIKAMSGWREHGLLAFTLNLQGGSPIGYGNKGWINSAFDEKGALLEPYMSRLQRIIKRADDLGMVIILGLFYQGQDQNITDEKGIINAVNNATDWLLQSGYRNVMIEINNECNVVYHHDILKVARVHELINLVKSKKRNGYRLLVSTSYGGGFIPLPNVVASADFLLIHGNSVKYPARITQMVAETRNVAGYHSMPVLFNEDDHYDFDQPDNNFLRAIKDHVSWGFFDYRRNGESFEEGFQSVPVDWQINSARKKGFFKLVKEMTKAEGEKKAR